MRLHLALILIVLAAVGPKASADQATVAVVTSPSVATVDSRYLSFAIDTAEIVGGPWWDGTTTTTTGRGSVRATPLDLKDARLVSAARALSPALLRIGGTEADFLAYDMSPSPAAQPPSGYDTLLTAARWDEVAFLASQAGLDLMFTLNAGKLERDSRGAWKPDHARGLMEHARAQGQRVAVWELGNEPNAYWLTDGYFLFGDQYARDYEAARALVRSASPGSRLAGPATAFWPYLGEPLGFIFGITEPFLRSVTGGVDDVTWHFYPTESDRTPLVLRPATLADTLSPSTLDEAGKWAREVKEWRDRWQPGAACWLGETGPAQCGGEAGLSSTFADSFWWLDQLGLLATCGQTLQIRQTLVGADYGMLDSVDFSPRPDFWASLLWKELMGNEVLATSVTGSKNVRAYAHSTAARAFAPAGSVTLLLLNLSRTSAATVSLSGLAASKFLVYEVTAPQATSQTVLLNGAPIAQAAQGRVMATTSTFVVSPLSYVFIVAIP